MTESTILEIQAFMDEAHSHIDGILKYIEITKQQRPLNEKEKALLAYCSQMWSLTAYTMQMLDETTENGDKQ